jgi:hypothetical protein
MNCYLAHRNVCIDMKKLLPILLGGLFITTQVNAQSYVTQHADSVTQTWTGGPDPMLVHNDIRATGAPVSVKWRAVASSFAQGWSLSGFCDNQNCYAGSAVVAGAPFVSSPYSNSAFNDPANPKTFDAQFSGMAGAATGSAAWVRVLVKDNGDTMNTANHRTLTFIGVKGPTGITSVNVSDDNVVIFPNPARGAVNVIYDEHAGVRSVGVYSLLGRTVKIFKTQGNSAKIDLTDVPSGAYFLRLMNAQGNVVATRRFNHQ